MINKINRITAILICIGFMLILSGCVTMKVSSNQAIRIDSNVYGADVLIDGKQVGTTPYIGTVKKSKSTRVKVSATGYRANENSIPINRPGSHDAHIGEIYGENVFNLVMICIPIWPITTTERFYNLLFDSKFCEYSPDAFYIPLTPDDSRASADDTPSTISQSQENEIRYFAMTHHSLIAVEAQAGTGEYFDTLSKMIERVTDRTTAIEVIKKALLICEGNQALFGNDLIDQVKS